MKAGALALAVVLASAITAQAEVPQTIGFTARLVDDKTGAELTGAHALEFRLFDAATGGTALWTERLDADLEEGLLFADLGASEPLTATVLDGRKLFLEVTLDGVTMEPRVTLGSVPYAVRADEAANAATVGGVPVDQLQKRVTGGCTSGNFIIGVNDDGTVACAPDLSGSGDITDVTAGNGLTGGGPAGNVTLSLIDCGQGEVLKFLSGVWTCAADSNAGGDITSVTVGGVGGLSGGGSTGDVQLSLLSTCAAGQILRFNGTWACSNDIDTNSGGTITGVTTAAGSGLVGGGTAGTLNLSLLTGCGNNQVLKFNTATSAWGCANDTDTNSGGDVTDVIGGAGLTATSSGGPAVTLDIGAGTGIIVAADTVSIDTAVVDLRVTSVGDPRYVNTAGDTMTGSLDLGGNRVTNRGCPTGYVKHGPGLCLEDVDDGNLTFAQCSNKCRVEGTHLCSSGELRAAAQSGVTIGNGGVLFDWLDDQDSITTALTVSDAGATTFAATSTGATSFCRCCASIE